MSKETSPAQSVVKFGGALAIALTPAAEVNTSFQKLDLIRSGNPIIINIPQQKTVEQQLQECVRTGTVETISQGVNDEGIEEAVDFFRDENGQLANRCTDGIMEVATNANGETEFDVNPLPRFTINNGEYPVREDGAKVVQAESEPADPQSNLDKIIQSLTIQNEGSEPIPPRAISRSVQEEGMSRMVGIMELIVNGQNPEIIEFTPAVDNIITNIRVFQIIDGGNGVHFICFDANDENPIYKDCTQTTLTVRKVIKVHDELNVRPDKSTNGTPVETAEPGDILEVVAGSTDSPLQGGNGYGWIQVQPLDDPNKDQANFVANVGGIEQGFAIVEEPGPTPAPEAPTEVIPAHQPEFFESLVDLPEVPQIMDSQGRYSGFISAGYLRDVANASDILIDENAVTVATTHIYSQIINKINSDLISKGQSPIDFEGNVKLKTLYPNHPTKRDQKVIEGNITHVNHYVLSWNELIQVKESIDPNDEQFIELYSNISGGDINRGLAYFNENGELNILTAPFHINGRPSVYSDINPAQDTLVTTYLMLRDAVIAGNMRLTTAKYPNANFIYENLGCNDSNEWCSEDSPTITVTPAEA